MCNNADEIDVECVCLCVRLIFFFFCYFGKWLSGCLTAYYTWISVCFVVCVREELHWMKHLSVNCRTSHKDSFSSTTALKSFAKHRKSGHPTYDTHTETFEKDEETKEYSMKYISILTNRQAKFVKGKRLSCAHTHTHTQQRAYFYLHTAQCWNILYGSRVCNVSFFSYFLLVRASKTDLIVRFICCACVYVSYVIFYCEDWANH